MACLDLFIPGLYSDLLAAHTGAPARWPATEKLLARAAVDLIGQTAVETLLCAACGVPVQGLAAPPIADVTAAIDLGAEAGAGWVRADPVHLRVDPARVLLFDARSLALSALEADTAIAELNAGLATHGVQLRRGSHPSRWYAKPAPAPGVPSFSPRSITGADAGRHLPAGAPAALLRRVMNDAQMLLHDSTVNSERTARGLPVVNSLWFWGAGALPAATGARPALVIGDDVLAAGLAARLGLDWVREVPDATAVLATLGRGRNALVVVGAPAGAIDDAPALSLDDFETRWCRPLLAALRRGRLARLRILTDRAAYTLTPGSAWRAWRRVQALPALRDELAARREPG